MYVAIARGAGIKKNSFSISARQELKRTEDTPDKAVGQIARYFGLVQENIGKGRSVESILVTRSASEELKYATRALKDCKLFAYEIQFKLDRVT